MKIIKRKVQAQRKFAQGAFVPPSPVSNPLPDRRAAAAPASEPPPPEQKNVYYSKMSADMLLDVISFQNLHKQPEPVVLLKRLGKIQNPRPPPPAEPTKQEPLRQRVTPAPITRPANKMRLRSRPGFKTQVIKKRVSPPYLRKRNIQPQTTVPDSSDLEDDRPLKYFARNAEVPRRQLRINAQVKKVKAKIDRKPSKVITTLKKSIVKVPVKKPALISKRAFQSIQKSSRRSETSIKKRRLSVETKNGKRKRDKSTLQYSSDEGPPLRSSSQKTAPLRSSSDAVPLLRSSSDNVPLLRSSSDNVPSLRTSLDNALPLRISDNKIPLRSSTDNGRPLRSSSDSGRPLRSSSDNLAPLRSSSDNLLPLRSSSDVPPLPFSSDEEMASPEPPKIKSPMKVNNKNREAVESWLDDAKTSTKTRRTNGFKMPLRPSRRRDAKVLETKGVVKKKIAGRLLEKKLRAKRQTASTINEKDEPKKAKSEPNPIEEPVKDTIPKQTLTKESLRNIDAQPVSIRHHTTVEGWLENSVVASVGMVASPEPAVLDSGLRSPSVDSLCPSERFKSVRDIVDASECDLDAGCKQRYCQACCRVNKLRQLKNMVQKSTGQPDDVYEFNDDVSVDSMRVYRRRPTVPPPPSPATALPLPTNPSPAPSTTPAPNPSPRTQDPVYLDILPNGSHIIQITNLNKRNTIISAKVIPKNKAEIRNEFSLIEHENLLDQLLTKLQGGEKLEDQENKDVTGSQSESKSDDPSGATSIRNIRRRAEPKVFKLSTVHTVKPAQSSRAEEPSVTKKSVEPPRIARRSVPKKSVEPAASSSEQAAPNDAVPLTGPDDGRLLDAPVFYPTEAEFTDPIAYFEKISPSAAKYGLCKVVPPAGFKPSCSVPDEIRFNVSNQYIARLYRRWGPAAREMCAIRAYLADQSVMFARSPLYEGIEVNLPKLYHIVQRNGGLKNVIEKKRWGRVAEEMRYTRAPNAEKRLDQLYVKYLLPYDTLSDQERQEIMVAVDRCWNKKNQKMLERALNPLHRQKRLLGESDSSGDEAEEEGNLAWALAEAEDCVVPGRAMTLATFKKVAANAMETLLPNSEQPSPEEVEREYWRLVLRGTEHVCVNTASIDTGADGHGFTKNKADPYGKHPWNLKMLSGNSGNVLRSLGAVLGVTAPTLHLGMALSTSCWHRDPHGLPWMEYMHSGPPSIWYGIPDEQSDKFRKAVEKLCPTSCQNKSIWLPSDIAMVPPELLRAHGVTLCRAVQRPAEFIIVLPKAYSCSIRTGYTQSESVYFATASWLDTVTTVFQEARDSCEPTMFSLEQLLLGVARDARAASRTLSSAIAPLREVIRNELRFRRELLAAGVTATGEQSRVRAAKRPAGAWNVREQDECDVCRATLYLSKVTGLTGKKSAVCLQHALGLIRGGKEPKSGALVVYSPQHELELGLRAAERRRAQYVLYTGLPELGPEHEQRAAATITDTPD